MDETISGPRRRRWVCAAVGVWLAWFGVACASDGPQRYAAMRRDLAATDAGAAANPQTPPSDPVGPLVAGAVAPLDAIAADDPLQGDAELERGALIELVLARNPGIEAARQTWRAALARYPQEIAPADPMLEAGFAPRAIGSAMVEAAPRIALSQTFYAPGKRALRGQAALGEAEAAAHDYEAVRLRLAALASMVFDDHRFSVRALAIGAQRIGLLENLQTLATQRYAGGEGELGGIARIELELARALHEQAILQSNARIAEAQINALLHRDPELPLPPPSEPGPAAPIEAAHAADPAETALQDNPPLRAAHARSTAAGAQLALARRSLLPDLRLDAAYDGVMPEEELRPFVGIAVEVPLQWGRRRAAIDEAEARLEAARHAALALEDEIAFEQRSALERLEEALHQLEIIEQRMLPAAHRRVAALRAAAESAQASLGDLLEAEIEASAMQIEFERAVAEVNRRRAECDRSRGRLPTGEW